MGLTDNQIEEEDQKNREKNEHSNGRVYNMSEIVKNAFQTKIH